ncbi:hypothetical protein F5Y15DRAFT_195730 [Xylariaceae sp. FL0016]|nr:hypothetical protein F5Y15DRAFT_195730 [Xylariaceae sp. FL0016]
MVVNTEPEALLSHLRKADGSATFSYAGYTVIGAVNGPIEIQRRDELPEEAAVDVIVRPAAGVGGTRERHLETILHDALRQIILVNNFPRTLIQIILQVTVAPQNEYANTKVVQANLVGKQALCEEYIMPEGKDRNIISNPTAREITQCQSYHVFAFTSHNELLLAESEGSFNMKEWDDVYATAQHQCCSLAATDDADTSMGDSEDVGADLRSFTRSILGQKMATDLHWK